MKRFIIGDEEYTEDEDEVGECSNCGRATYDGMKRCDQCNEDREYHKYDEVNTSYDQDQEIGDDPQALNTELSNSEPIDAPTGGDFYTIQTGGPKEGLGEFKGVWKQLGYEGRNTYHDSDWSKYFFQFIEDGFMGYKKFECITGDCNNVVLDNSTDAIKHLNDVHNIITGYEKFESRKQQQWYHATDQTYLDDEPHENRKVKGEKLNKDGTGTAVARRGINPNNKKHGIMKFDYVSQSDCPICRPYDGKTWHRTSPNRPVIPRLESQGKKGGRPYTHPNCKCRWIKVFNEVYDKDNMIGESVDPKLIARARKEYGNDKEWDALTKVERNLLIIEMLKKDLGWESESKEFIELVDPLPLASMAQIAFNAIKEPIKHRLRRGESIATEAKVKATEQEGPYGIQPMLDQIVNKSLGKEEKAEIEEEVSKDFTLDNLLQLVADKLAKKAAKKMGLESRRANEGTYINDEDNCDHTEIDDNDFCRDCGKFMESYKYDQSEWMKKYKNGTLDSQINGESHKVKGNESHLNVDPNDGADWSKKNCPKCNSDNTIPVMSRFRPNMHLCNICSTAWQEIDEANEYHWMDQNNPNRDLSDPTWVSAGASHQMNRERTRRMSDSSGYVCQTCRFKSGSDEEVIKHLTDHPNHMVTQVKGGESHKVKANERDMMTNRQMNDQAYDIMAEEEWGKSVEQLTDREYKWIEDLMQDYGNELTSDDKPKTNESHKVKGNEAEDYGDSRKHPAEMNDHELDETVSDLEHGRSHDGSGIDSYERALDEEIYWRKTNGKSKKDGSGGYITGIYLESLASEGIYGRYDDYGEFWEGNADLPIDEINKDLRKWEQEHSGWSNVEREDFVVELVEKDYGRDVWGYGSDMLKLLAGESLATEDKEMYYSIQSWWTNRVRDAWLDDVHRKDDDYTNYTNPSVNIMKEIDGYNRSGWVEWYELSDDEKESIINYKYSHSYESKATEWTTYDEEDYKSISPDVLTDDKKEADEYKMDTLCDTCGKPYEDHERFSTQHEFKFPEGWADEGTKGGSGFYSKHAGGTKERLDDLNEWDKKKDNAYDYLHNTIDHIEDGGQSWQRGEEGDKTNEYIIDLGTGSSGYECEICGYTATKGYVAKHLKEEHSDRIYESRANESDTSYLEHFTYQYSQIFQGPASAQYIHTIRCKICNTYINNNHGWDDPEGPCKTHLLQHDMVFESRANEVNWEHETLVDWNGQDNEVRDLTMLRAGIDYSSRNTYIQLDGHLSWSTLTYGDQLKVIEYFKEHNKTATEIDWDIEEREMDKRKLGGPRPDDDISGYGLPKGVPTPYEDDNEREARIQKQMILNKARSQMKDEQDNPLSGGHEWQQGREGVKEILGDILEGSIFMGKDKEQFKKNLEADEVDPNHFADAKSWYQASADKEKLAGGGLSDDYDGLPDWNRENIDMAFDAMRSGEQVDRSDFYPESYSTEGGRGSGRLDHRPWMLGAELGGVCPTCMINTEWSGSICTMCGEDRNSVAVEGLDDDVYNSVIDSQTLRDEKDAVFDSYYQDIEYQKNSEQAEKDKAHREYEEEEKRKDDAYKRSHSMNSQTYTSQYAVNPDFGAHNRAVGRGYAGYPY